jgi:hypothetical protein
MSEGGKGVWGAVLAFFAVLLKVWAEIPQKSKDKLIATIVEGFDGILRRFFRKFHGVDSDPAQEIVS